MGDPKVRACTFISGFITTHLSHLYTHSYVVLYILKGDNLQAHKSKLFIPRTTCSVYLCSTKSIFIEVQQTFLELALQTYYKCVLQSASFSNLHDSQVSTAARPMGQTATKINLECFCSGASVSQEFPIFFIWRPLRFLILSSLRICLFKHKPKPNYEKLTN